MGFKYKVSEKEAFQGARAKIRQSAVFTFNYPSGCSKFTIKKVGSILHRDESRKN